MSQVRMWVFKIPPRIKMNLLKVSQGAGNQEAAQASEWIISGGKIINETLSACVECGVWSPNI